MYNNSDWKSIPLILDSHRTAILLGVQQTTITRWARQGEIPCKKIGKRYFFVKEEIIKFMKVGG